MDTSNDLPKLSNPAWRALANAGITQLDQVAGKTEAEISALHGVGPKTIRQLRDALARHGLTFAPGLARTGSRRVLDS